MQVPHSDMNLLTRSSTPTRAQYSGRDILNSKDSTEVPPRDESSLHPVDDQEFLPSHSKVNV
ncbi:hypothetical protein M758_UG311200 [Ceratodon purpureus]|nr:hypothetical protein M758_UG311200 [Ceratodon purpureus]